jgi:hypothetical protein
MSQSLLINVLRIDIFHDKWYGHGHDNIKGYFKIVGIILYLLAMWTYEMQ